MIVEASALLTIPKRVNELLDLFKRLRNLLGKSSEEIIDESVQKVELIVEDLMQFSKITVELSRWKTIHHHTQLATHFYLQQLTSAPTELVPFQKYIKKSPNTFLSELESVEIHTLTQLRVLKPEQKLAPRLPSDDPCDKDETWDEAMLRVWQEMRDHLGNQNYGALLHSVRVFKEICNTYNTLADKGIKDHIAELDGLLKEFQKSTFNFEPK